MDPGIFTLILFGSLALCLVLGFPLAFILTGLSMVFFFLFWGPKSLFMVSTCALSTMSSLILVAIPLFIFMATILERSGIAEAMFAAAYRWMGSLRGGLAIGTVLICTVFAAMSGISGAATVSMGLVALPAMLKRDYSKGIALGCIAAGGALGVLIPPSVMMIIFALIAGESVGRLFLGGVFPGLLLSGMFCVYIGVRCFLRPRLGPGVPLEERVSLGEKIKSLRGIILPVILVFVVLGSIFGGIASPTEAAALGALGSLVCAAVHRKLNWETLKQASYRTLTLSCMVLWIIYGALLFTDLYAGMGGIMFVKELIMEAGWNRWVVVILMQVVLFILGCFLDPTGIVMLCTPIFVPIIRDLGFNVVWFGVLFVVNMEMSFLTPPFGFNLFYIKSVAPEGTTMEDIYRSVGPFIALQALGLALVMIFPQIILWLPNLIIK